MSQPCDSPSAKTSVLSHKNISEYFMVWIPVVSAPNGGIIPYILI